MAKKKRLKILLVILIVLFLALILGGGIYMMLMKGNGKFFSRTTLNGYDISDMEPDQAAEMLEKTYKDASVVINEKGKPSIEGSLEDFGCSVLIKGGHQLNDANDLLYSGSEMTWYKGERIDNPNTHGTGCTLSSAIASNLAKGFGLAESITRAKRYISGALAAMLDLGSGSGPMDHGFAIDNDFTAYPAE